jgi:hypothetical protein
MADSTELILNAERQLASSRQILSINIEDNMQAANEVMQKELSFNYQT